jgi:hypothetical protein
MSAIRTQTIGDLPQPRHAMVYLVLKTTIALIRRVPFAAVFWDNLVRVDRVENMELAAPSTLLANQTIVSRTFYGSLGRVNALTAGGAVAGVVLLARNATTQVPSKPTNVLLWGPDFVVNASQIVSA